MSASSGSHDQKGCQTPSRQINSRAGLQTPPSCQRDPGSLGWIAGGVGATVNEMETDESNTIASEEGRYASDGWREGCRQPNHEDLVQRFGGGKYPFEDSKHDDMVAVDAIVTDYYQEEEEEEEEKVSREEVLCLREENQLKRSQKRLTTLERDIGTFKRMSLHSVTHDYGF